MNTLFNCSLWGDEAFSAVLSQKPLSEIIRVLIKDTSPPLFYIINHFWFKLFGSSEISIRSLSFLFYLGTMIFIYAIVKETFKNKVSALLATILCFLNPFLFPYGFEGRMYYCLFFFVTASFYFLIKKNLPGYIISSSAALYSHHFSVLALFSQFLWIILFSKKNKGELFKIIKTYLLIAISYLPWIYPFYLQTKLVAGGFWLGKPKWSDFFQMFSNFIGRVPSGKYYPFIVFSVIFLLITRKWLKKNRSVEILFLLWAIVPSLLAFLISQTKISIFYERYLLYSTIPISILISSRLRKISYPALLFLTIIYFNIALKSFFHPFKKPFNEFAKVVKNKVDQNTFLINYNGRSHHLWESKYYKLNAPLFSSKEKLPFFVGTAQMTDNDVVENLPKDKKIAVITSDNPESIEIENRRRDKIYKVDSLSLIIFDQLI